MATATNFLRPGRVKGHAIRWFVYAGGERLPREAGMRGSWDGFDAECECGWASRTGGAVRSYVESRVLDHKQDVLIEKERG